MAMRRWMASHALACAAIMGVLAAAGPTVILVSSGSLEVGIFVALAFVGGALMSLVYSTAAGMRRK